VGDRRVSLNRIGPGPEKKIARAQIVELVGIVTLTQNRFEGMGPAQPVVLFGGIARHIGDAILFQDKINKTGAIHPAGRRIV